MYFCESAFVWDHANAKMETGKIKNHEIRFKKIFVKIFFEISKIYRFYIKTDKIIIIY